MRTPEQVVKEHEREHKDSDHKGSCALMVVRSRDAEWIAFLKKHIRFSALLQAELKESGLLKTEDVNGKD